MALKTSLARARFNQQFHVPGAEHLDYLQTGDFEWTRDIMCPGNHQAELGGDTTAILNPTLASPSASGETSSDEPTAGRRAEEKWGVSATVAPSQMMRDGVRFEGLGVSIFIGEGHNNQVNVDDASCNFFFNGGRWGLMD